MVVKEQKIPLVGIIFIAIGAGLLLRQLHIVPFTFGTIFFGGVTVGGALLVVRCYLNNVRRGIFFGSLCFYGGMLFFLSECEYISHQPSVIIPALLVGLGLSFLSLFIFNPRDIHLLIPVLVFAGFGATFALTELGYWYYEDVWNITSQYWPLLLILFGLLIVFRKRTS